jgi:hypothetical protein
MDGFGAMISTGHVSDASSVPSRPSVVLTPLVRRTMAMQERLEETFLNLFFTLT